MLPKKESIDHIGVWYESLKLAMRNVNVDVDV